MLMLLTLKFWWKVLTLRPRSGLLFTFFFSDLLLKELEPIVREEHRLLGVMAGKYGTPGLYSYSMKKVIWLDRYQERWSHIRQKAQKKIGFNPNTKLDSELSLWLQEGNRPRVRGA